jgi:hypothetical protein
VNTSPTVTGTIDDACPYGGETTGVQPMAAPPRVQAWHCSVCTTEWAISVIRPDSLTDLGVAAQEIGRLRRILRQLCTLADDAPTITDRELRTRLLALASDAR